MTRPTTRGLSALWSMAHHQQLLLGGELGNPVLVVDVHRDLFAIVIELLGLDHEGVVDLLSSSRSTSMLCTASA